MNADQPSRTAAMVAISRGLYAALPSEVRLVEDPFGARFGGPLGLVASMVARRLPRGAARLVAAIPPVENLLVWIQVRTRVLDDLLLRFVRRGGQQVLLLGAGFDCRAARFARELDGVAVYEVDHPATQARKRRVLGPAATSGRVEYLPFDFERQSMDELPGRLAARGHKARRPTLTIWEGVTMYLTEPAIEASVAAIRELSAPGSSLAFTYIERERVAALPTLSLVPMRLLAPHEPLRFGFPSSSLSDWLSVRGFALSSDRSGGELMETLVPSRYARQAAARALERIAVATRRPVPLA